MLTSDYASVDDTQSPPDIGLPSAYNAALEFVDHNVQRGWGERVALIDDRGAYSYRALSQRVNRCGNVLRDIGVGVGDRILICLPDGIELVTVFWATVKIGAVAVPLNTRLTEADYRALLFDSAARVVLTDRHLAMSFQRLASSASFACEVIVVDERSALSTSLSGRMAEASNELTAWPTTSEDIAFWLYTSGSTGTPKGVMHRHQALIYTAVLFGQSVLKVSPEDVTFSAAKMHFAYGLGNAMTFPFYAGATSIVTGHRPTAEHIVACLCEYQPTLFFAVPTLYAQLLTAFEEIPKVALARLRLCVSAGEALPEEVARRWVDRCGIDIIDGLGTTEMLQTFLSNRPGEIRFGTSGKPVPGYTVRLVDRTGAKVARGNVGALEVKGKSAAVGYWNQPAKTQETFVGEWVRTGDQYVEDDEGFYHYRGRRDDMLKVGGIWVSPTEVESVLLRHPQVADVAVVGRRTREGLEKPCAYVVLKDNIEVSTQLKDDLKALTRSQLALYKYPRWIKFIDQLPRTSTGKIQRYRLHDMYRE